MGDAVVAIGWLGNACYFSRFLVQWLASERQKKSVAPRSFWWLSLAGTVLLSVYTYRAGDAVLLAGYLFTLVIYARNLALPQEGSGGPRPVPWGLLALAFVGWGVLVAINLGRVTDSLSPAPFLVVGIVGQTVWSSRFVVQWLWSERRGEAHFPVVFWWISLVGNALLLTYAIHKADAVWIAGLCVGPIVQVRNLMLHRARKRAPAAPGEDPAPAVR